MRKETIEMLKGKATIHARRHKEYAAIAANAFDAMGKAALTQGQYWKSDVQAFQKIFVEYTEKSVKEERLTLFFLEYLKEEIGNVATSEFAATLN